MAIEPITTVAGYLASLGLDVAKERFRQKLDEKKLLDAFASFVERERKYNELCTMTEEIDFQGLVEYIQNNLLEQAGVRVFDPNRKKRMQATKTEISELIYTQQALLMMILAVIVYAI